MGAEPAALRRHAGHQPGRPGALRLRAARRARAPRALEAAAGAATDAVGARQHQGPAWHLRQGRAREPARHAALHPRRPAAGVRRPRRSAPARRSRRCVDRGVGLDRRLRRVSRDGSRAAQQGLVPSRPRAFRAEVQPRRRASRSAPIACWRSRCASCTKTQEEFRRVASRVNGGDPLAAWQKTKADHPPAGQARVGRRGAARGARRLHPPRAHHHASRRRAGRRAANPALLPLDVRQHVDTRTVRVAAGARVLLHHRRRSGVAGGASGRAPARLQLRRAVVDLDSRGVPRPLPALSAPAPGRARRCASRSCSRRRRSSKAGPTTASR